MAGMPGSRVGPVPIVRMYGVTMDGNSVLCHIHGFVPYFYVPAPPGFESSKCSIFQDALNRAVLGDMRSNKDNVTQVRDKKQTLNSNVSSFIFASPPYTSQVIILVVLVTARIKLKENLSQ